MSVRIESLLAARQHFAPQIVGERVFFISSLSGRLSLYTMYYGGSVPEPLLPPDISLQNPELIGGYSYWVFPELERILVMLDQNGDENYQPMVIPLQGGYPEPAFRDFFASYRVHLADVDPLSNTVYFSAEYREQGLNAAFQADLRLGELVKLDESVYGCWPTCPDRAAGRVLLADSYSAGDSVLWLLENGRKTLLYGQPLEARSLGEVVPPNGLGAAAWLPGGKGVLVSSAVFDDAYSLGLIELDKPGKLTPVGIEGLVHRGRGELVNLRHLKASRYLVEYNIDGCSWAYEGIYRAEKRLLSVQQTIVGDGDLAQGKLDHLDYDRTADRFVLTFSTATSPTQIYTVEARDRQTVVRHTDERILGIPDEELSQGEDASFTSFDGTRISARLYLPAEALGFSGPRPLVYYVHGGPQGQERPDFAWFSMPLIQFLTLRGFAVFVPNVRGSTGYGLAYTKQVDCDWGGQDRLDHVHAMTRVLPGDERLDVRRAAVVGRSYGGYMTLTLAGRHPELWSAACDMFGPYDLVTFFERLPETWKPFFRITLADPDTLEGRDFMVERSPRTYLQALGCPLLVIQGRNDPRVVAGESETLAADLKQIGKQVELLVFEDEGHDVLKFPNRVVCYNAIADFFTRALKP
jgi:pimeloyl-ACP methyl ester carboxylesterase